MSEENVELVRRGVQDVEAFWALLDEYVVWDLREHPYLDVDPVVVGRDAVIAASRRYWGTWADYRLDAEELIDAGSSVVISLRERGRGKGSGAPFDTRWAQVWTFHRGRVIRWELFADKAAAFEAAGLREQAMAQENVETVRRVYAEWKLGKMTAGVNLFDPEIVFESFMPDADERILVNGTLEIERFMREFLAQWRDFRILGEEFKESEGGKVFVAGRQSATGRSSGILVDDSLHSVWTFRQGAVVRLTFERDRRKALEAAGLSE